MRRPRTGNPAQPASEKPLSWCGAALRELRAFPEDARQAAGRQLRKLQEGTPPDDWKPMPTVGPGTIEIRIHTRTEHRVFLVAKFEEAVYVLHAFEKKSQKTPQHAIDLAKQRYQDLVRERRR